MREKPILMNTEMVARTLADDKTQTRRIMKPHTRRIIKLQLISDLDSGRIFWGKYQFDIHKMPYSDELPKFAPYQVGDILWVRESAKVICKGRSGYREIVIKYIADDAIRTVPYPERLAPIPMWKKLSNGVYKEACRLRLEVTQVRVERLNDISEEDAIAEGCKSNIALTAKGDFRFLWQSIYGWKSWEDNVYVWVIEFKKVQ